MTNRYYDPGTGRFLTRDPIGYGGGINLYGFVGNNPVTGADPEGTRPLNEADKTRLQKLLSYQPATSRRAVLKADIRVAVKEITSAIHAVGGKTDPASLRAIFWAIDNLGNTNYGPAGRVDDGHNQPVAGGQYKCNIFAADAYAIGGGIGWGPSGVPTNAKLGGLFGHFHPYAANDLANRSTRVRNFPVVDGRHREIGDIAAFDNPGGEGHTVLYLGGGMCIYAGPNDVKMDTVMFVLEDGHDYVTYRRYRP